MIIEFACEQSVVFVLLKCLRTHQTSSLGFHFMPENFIQRKHIFIRISCNKIVSNKYKRRKATKLTYSMNRVLLLR